MKTIGVLGGLGPQATMDFEVRLHRESQRLIPPQMNGGYPPMVVHYHTIAGRRSGSATRGRRGCRSGSIRACWRPRGS
jgi:aspartate/glutamate racemase